MRSLRFKKKSFGLYVAESTSTEKYEDDGRLLTRWCITRHSISQPWRLCIEDEFGSRVFVHTRLPTLKRAKEVANLMCLCLHHYVEGRPSWA